MVSDIVLITFIIGLSVWVIMKEEPLIDDITKKKFDILEQKIEDLKSKENEFKTKQDEFRTTVLELKSMNDKSKEKISNLKAIVGKKQSVTYVRHGNHGCPSTAELVYTGYTGGAYYSNGGGSNYLCLPKDPDWPAGATDGHQSNSYIYGTEYEINSKTVIDKTKHDNDVPCAVCEANGKSEKLMIPAKTKCPYGWSKEFDGILMATYKLSTDFTCVDSSMQTLDGGGENKDGALFYVVEVVCGSLSCPPYVHGYELSCVLCTK